MKAFDELLDEAVASTRRRAFRSLPKHARKELPLAKRKLALLRSLITIAKQEVWRFYSYKTLGEKDGK